MSENGPYCVSNVHDPPVPATSHGIYANGQDVRYCEACATTGESLSLFARD